MKNIKFIPIAVLIFMLPMVGACTIGKSSTSSSSASSSGSSGGGGTESGGSSGGALPAEDLKVINAAIDSGDTAELKKLLTGKTPKQLDAIKKQKKNNFSLAKSAIYNANQNQLSALIENNLVDLQEKNEEGENLLHEAVLRGPEFVDLIVKKAPQLASMKNELGNTPLHLAAFGYNLDSFIALAKTDPNLLKAKDKLGYTPLMIAAKNSSAAEFNKVMDALLELDAFKEEASKKALLEEKNTDGNTMMHLAAIVDSAQNVEKLLTVDKDLAAITNNTGFTPFLAAVNQGTESVVKKFIDVDKSFVKQKLKQMQMGKPVEFTAAEIAVDRGNPKVLKAILNSSPELIKGLAHRAAQFAKNLSIFKVLYEQDNDIFNKLNDNGYSPLLVFSSLNNQYDDNTQSFEIGSYLIEHTKKEIVDHCTDTIRSPLHVALSNGNEKIVRAFIEKKANLDVVCGGNKPIHTLVNSAYANNYNSSTLKLFIDSLDGAQINAPDENNNSTALLYAVVNAGSNIPINLKVIDALKTHKDLDPNIGKFKPLEYAVKMTIEPEPLLEESKPRYNIGDETKGWQISYVNNVERRVSTQSRRNQIINSLLEIENIDLKDAFSQAAYHHDTDTLEALIKKDPELLNVKTRIGEATEANLAVWLAVSQALSKDASKVKNKGSKTIEDGVATNLLTKNTNETLDKLKELGLDKEWFSRGVLFNSKNEEILWKDGAYEIMGRVSWSYDDVKRKLEDLSK